MAALQVGGWEYTEVLKRVAIQQMYSLPSSANYKLNNSSPLSLNK
jgi:hypothetical protein